ncbi:hypothetical protein CTAYLR_010317 [Chrysophaeum taylorii]|uniref:Derlin n=1 Tax=Chrysophaeum taylorii TaxID=2483200 RepID=A0AAD7UJD6_9STRA|nr:hypothetical protein CTAYLR_010317 [Chrysophaeum taylorii]
MRNMAVALVIAAMVCLRSTTALAGRRSLSVSRTSSLSRGKRSVQVLRGGSDDDEEYVDEDDEEETVEASVEEADFEGDTIKARAVKAWGEFHAANDSGLCRRLYWANARRMGAALQMSLDLVFDRWLTLDWRASLTRMQIWRPLTSFLFYGPFGLSYLLTIHFVWTYMSTLEKLAHAEPWEFALMMFFGAGLLLAGVSLGGMNSRFLGHNLSCFLVYIWARTFEGQEVNVMEFFNIKAELLPWFFAAQTYLLEHELPVSDLLGIAIGHLYVWTRQRDVLRTPDWLVRLFRSRPKLMAKYEAMADEFS